MVRAAIMRNYVEVFTIAVGQRFKSYPSGQAHVYFIADISALE
jgi:hypothetical protein